MVGLDYLRSNFTFFYVKTREGNTLGKATRKKVFGYRGNQLVVGRGSRFFRKMLPIFSVVATD